MDALIAHFQTMARYNRIANARLYDAVALLPRAEFERPRPAFFGSIQGVLNHLITGDRIWLTRFEGGRSPSTDLDAILFEGFAELRAARVAEDDRIDRMAANLTADFLMSEIAYVNNEGRDMRDSALVAVAHFFNHETHHRGQAHDMLSQTDVPPPSLDMHRCLNP